MGVPCTRRPVRRPPCRSARYYSRHAAIGTRGSHPPRWPGDAHHDLLQRARGGGSIDRGLTQLTGWRTIVAKGPGTSGAESMGSTCLTTGNVLPPAGAGKGSLLAAGDYLRVGDYLYAQGHG